MASWRDPVIPLDVREDPYTVVDYGSGPQLDVILVLSERDTERIRLGYVCIQPHCLEPHERPFPERCASCGYAMRENQTKDFERQYGGTELMDAGSRRIRAELDRMAEESERVASANRPSILVPRSISSAPKTSGGIVLPPGVKGA